MNGNQQTTSIITNNTGTFCIRCGSKSYLSKDGTHRRCPNCDDINS